MRVKVVELWCLPFSFRWGGDLGLWAGWSTGSEVEDGLEGMGERRKENQAWWGLGGET